MLNRMSRPIAILAIGALAACSSGSTSTPAAPPVVPPSGMVIAGIGDSLTAGFQSDGFLGDTTVTNPLSAYPGNAVPPGQESGFFSILYQQATGATLGQIANPATSILPLIKGPGLGGQIVLNATTLLATTHSPCDAFNNAAYSSSGWASTRMNPTGAISDLAVPGITMHEAVAMHAPLTGPPNGSNCGYVSIPGDPTSGALQSLVQGESQMFYPVLGSFQASLGRNLTMLNAGVALKPGIATVWLGANDLLKFIFSGGRSPATDTPQQMATDLTQIITTLKASGAKVVVGDLPNVLGTPQFFPQPKISADLQALGVPAPAAGAIVAYLGTQYGVGTNGFITESAFLAIVAELQSSTPTLTPNLDPNGPQSGLGGAYLPDAFAAQVQGLNTAYNTAIDGVAASTGVALAPITATFNQIAATGVPLVPGKTATLQFGGGIVSWDGLHPSNLGYALIANAFIGALDTQYSMTIAPLTGPQIVGIAFNDPYNPFVIKAGNPASPFPLP